MCILPIFLTSWPQRRWCVSKGAFTFWSPQRLGVIYYLLSRPPQCSWPDTWAKGAVTFRWLQKLTQGIHHYLTISSINSIPYYLTSLLGVNSIHNRAKELLQGCLSPSSSRPLRSELAIPNTSERSVLHDSQFEWLRRYPCKSEPSQTFFCNLQ